MFEVFSDNSSYLTDKSSSFNAIFRTFLNSNLGVELEELLPYVQYASQFYWKSTSDLLTNYKIAEEIRPDDVTALNDLVHRHLPAAFN